MLIRNHGLVTEILHTCVALNDPKLNGGNPIVVIAAFIARHLERANQIPENGPVVLTTLEGLPG